MLNTLNSCPRRALDAAIDSSRPAVCSRKCFFPWIRLSISQTLTRLPGNSGCSAESGSEGRGGVVRRGGQFIEVRMRVNNRWDEATEECFVGGLLLEGGGCGEQGGEGETRPVSRLRAPKAPRPRMPRVSPLTGEMGLEHRVFHQQTLPVSSEEYPSSSSTRSPVRVWGEECTRYNKEGTWHGTWGFESRLLHTLSRIRIFPASAVHFHRWHAVNRIFQAGLPLQRCLTI